MFKNLMEEMEKSKKNWEKIETMLNELKEEFGPPNDNNSRDERVFHLLCMVIDQMRPMYDTNDDVSKILDAFMKQ